MTFSYSLKLTFSIPIIPSLSDISAFSSGANGKTDAAGNYSEGTDYDLDEATSVSMLESAYKAFSL